MRNMGEHGAAGDRELILRVIADQQEAWNGGDGASFGRRTDPHIIFTNIFGQQYHGRDKFVERHRLIFESFLSGTTAQLEVSAIHFLGPDVAVVNIDCLIEGVGSPLGSFAGADGRGMTRCLKVMRRNGDDWQVTHFHNVPVDLGAP